MKRSGRFSLWMMVLVDVLIFLTFAKSLNYLSTQDIVVSVILCVYLLLLYIFSFYRNEQMSFLKNIATTILMLVVFDIINILFQYIVFYETLYGRKVILKLDLLLLGYHVVRWGGVQAFVSKLEQVVLFLRPAGGELENPAFGMLKSDFSGIEDFKISGNVFISETNLINAEGDHINTEDKVVLIDSSEVFNEEEHSWLLAEKIKGSHIYTIENFCETYLEKIPISSVTDEWLILSRGFENIFEGFYVRARRIFDIAVSIFGLCVASPLMGIGAVMIRLDSKGPIFFSQVRTGQHGKPFTIYKFRSMRIDAEKDGAQWAKKNDSRITKVGDFIRKTRIDEIPQLWNVLKGDMSFIGPRPERPEFDGTLEKEIPYYMLRYLVKPGLTGWAQVNYDYGASIDDAKEKVMYDLFYIKNYSFLLDIRIILRTVRIVLFRKGR